MWPVGVYKAEEKPLDKNRIRITYGKGDPLKYISHLDLARTWERAFRRAGLPLAYSQGYNPRPRFQIAAALPVGVTGRAERMDLWLSPLLAADEVRSQLGAVLPRGLSLQDSTEVDLGEPSLQSRMEAAEYEVRLRISEPEAALEARLQTLWQAPTLLRQRHHKGKMRTYDLRPLIFDLGVECQGEGECMLTMSLQLSPKGAGRPDEVLDALGLSHVPHELVRTRLVLGPIPA